MFNVLHRAFSIILYITITNSRLQNSLVSAKVGLSCVSLRWEPLSSADKNLDIEGFHWNEILSDFPSI